MSFSMFHFFDSAAMRDKASALSRPKQSFFRESRCSADHKRIDIEIDTCRHTRAQVFPQRSLKCSLIIDENNRTRMNRQKAHSRGDARAYLALAVLSISLNWRLLSIYIQEIPSHEAEPKNPSPKGRIKKTKRIANSPAQIVFIFGHKIGTKRRPELPVRRYSKKASRNSQSFLTQKTILSRCFYCCSTASFCSLNRKTLFFVGLVGEFLVCACYYFYFFIP